MELIKKYNGAVFFVDMLGISALTNNRIDLTADDYKWWLDEYDVEPGPQYLAAALLSKFREILVELKPLFKTVTISQLSDCAFIWSENITEVVLFASRFANRAIYEGLLCRGGMAYGEIIETKQEHNLGRFILGNAVTEAANLEKTAKGARILINQELPQALWQENEKLYERISPVFAPFTNPLDYAIYDEFLWYLCDDLTGNVHNMNVISGDKNMNADKVRFTKERLRIANFVRCSPKFNWNSRSKEGNVQLNATINFISRNALLNVVHNFDWSGGIGIRSNGTVEAINKSIENDEGYSIVRRTNAHD